MKQMILNTDRLTLATLDASFAPRVLDYVVRNWQFFRPWNPAVGEEFFTLDFQRSKLQTDSELMEMRQLLRFWLFSREDRLCERIIGDVALSNIVWGAFCSCHLGYKIDQSATNQGLMTEAVRAIIDFAFNELRLHRVEANIMPRNWPSRRLVEKLGFINEGSSAKYLKINGVWEDHIHYVVLNLNEE